MEPKLTPDVWSGTVKFTAGVVNRPTDLMLCSRPASAQITSSVFRRVKISPRGGIDKREANCRRTHRLRGTLTGAPVYFCTLHTVV